ncbi:sensor histidine kinase [Microtetraspora glauca]|uniref:histidine kinase n=1 Tax=Microtetraspora glauca TaxID=1996 RepID=A0ABV3GD56_MICGL
MLWKARVISAERRFPSGRRGRAPARVCAAVGRLSRRADRRQTRLDLLLWVVLCLPMVAAPGDPYDWEPLTGHRLAGVIVAGTAVLALAVLVSRAAPLASMLVVLVMGPWATTDALATVSLWPLNTTVKVGPVNGFSLAIVVFSYLAGRRMAGSRMASRLFAGILGACVLLALVSTCGPQPTDDHVWQVWVPILTGVLLTSVLPWAVGHHLRQRVERRDRERRMTAERARLRERARIAQDMHDSLGHELALIALRAGALEMSADLDDRSRAAAAELRKAAGATTERLRGVIGLLRDDAETAPLAPADENVAALIDRAAASGMTIELRGDAHDPSWAEPPARDPSPDPAGDVTHGTAGDMTHDPAGDETGDSARGPAYDAAGDVARRAARRAVHRVVQEALTNAAKHAPGAPVTVTLGRTDRELTVSVTNPAPGTPAGEGSGLIGLAERVDLAGGVFAAGARGGRFEVTARVPLRSGPALRSGPSPFAPSQFTASRFTASRFTASRFTAAEPGPPSDASAPEAHAQGGPV